MDAVLKIQIKGVFPDTQQYVEQELQMRLTNNADVDRKTFESLMAPWHFVEQMPGLFNFTGEGYRNEFSKHKHALKAFQIDNINNGDINIVTYGKWVR
jgi:hypothetical protein